MFWSDPRCCLNPDINEVRKALPAFKLADKLLLLWCLNRCMNHFHYHDVTDDNSLGRIIESYINLAKDRAEQLCDKYPSYLYFANLLESTTVFETGIEWWNLWKRNENHARENASKVANKDIDSLIRQQKATDEKRLKKKLPILLPKMYHMPMGDNGPVFHGNTTCDSNRLYYLHEKKEPFQINYTLYQYVSNEEYSLSYGIPVRINTWGLKHRISYLFCLDVKSLQLALGSEDAVYLLTNSLAECELNDGTASVLVRSMIPARVKRMLLTLKAINIPLYEDFKAQILGEAKNWAELYREKDDFDLPKILFEMILSLCQNKDICAAMLGDNKKENVSSGRLPHTIEDAIRRCREDKIGYDKPYYFIQATEQMKPGATLSDLVSWKELPEQLKYKQNGQKEDSAIKVDSRMRSLLSNLRGFLCSFDGVAMHGYHLEYIPEGLRKIFTEMKNKARPRKKYRNLLEF